MLSTTPLFSIDWQTVDIILELFGYAFLSVVGWFIKSILDKIKHIDKTTTKAIEDLRTDVKNVYKEAQSETNRINVTLPANYVTKLEFSRSIDGLFHEIRALGDRVDSNKDQMFNKMDKISDKMDGKQDKT